MAVKLRMGGAYGAYGFADRFATLSVSILGLKLDETLEVILEGNGHDLLETLFYHLPGF
jgi:hypothetical protein